MQSDFLIQVVHRETGRVVAWAPGMDVEKDFIRELGDRVAAKGVGMGRTTEHVVADVKEACAEMLYELKAMVR